MFNKPNFLAAVFALGMAVSTGGAWAAPTAISGCGTFTGFGLHVLTQNINATAVVGDCIFIDNNHITLDLNGFVIAGPGAVGGAPTGHGVTSNFRQNITVRNGTVVGFTTGVALGNVDGAVVEDVRAIGNDAIGIYVRFGSTVRRNTALDNGGNGIQFSEGSSLTDNVSRGNGDKGIFGSCPATVVGNTLTDNTGLNLDLNNLADCTVEHNTAP